MPKEERRRVGMGGAHEYAAGVNSKPVTKLGLASCVESDAGIPDSEFLVKAPTRETQERQRGLIDVQTICRGREFRDRGAAGGRTTAKPITCSLRCSM